MISLLAEVIILIMGYFLSIQNDTFQVRLINWHSICRFIQVTQIIKHEGMQTTIFHSEEGYAKKAYMMV